MTYLKAAVDGLEVILILSAEVDVSGGEKDRTDDKGLKLGKSTMQSKSLNLKINEHGTAQMKFKIYIEIVAYFLGFGRKYIFKDVCLMSILCLFYFIKITNICSL